MWFVVLAPPIRARRKRKDRHQWEDDDEFERGGNPLDAISRGISTSLLPCLLLMRVGVYRAGAIARSTTDVTRVLRATPGRR